MQKKKHPKGTVPAIRAVPGLGIVPKVHAVLLESKKHQDPRKV